MNDETTHEREPARAGETQGADAAQAEREADLQAEQDSAAAMNADVPQPAEDEAAGAEQAG